MIRIHNMLLAAALASSIALPCAAESLSLADLADAQDAQMIDMDAQDGAWTYPIPYDLLMTSDYIVLANKESLLDETYVPQDLVKLTCRKISSDPIQMREVAAQALSDMFDAAKADGVTLYAHSGYRSYRTQKTMYSNRLKRNNGKDDGVVAYPGASDHQTGLGIDVINKAGNRQEVHVRICRHQRGQVDCRALLGLRIRHPLSEGKGRNHPDHL